MSPHVPSTSPLAVIGPVQRFLALRLRGWLRSPWGLSACHPANERSSVVGVAYGGECAGQVEQVTVVDPSVLQLTSEVTEHARPVLASGWDRRRDLHAPLDDPDRGQAGGG